MNGTIKNIKEDKGYGFILGEDGKEYFFHFTGLKNKKIHQLSKNDSVTFEATSGSKGLRAEEIYA